MIEVLNNGDPLRIALDEVLELSFREQLRPAEENVEAQLDLLLFDASVGRTEGAEALLQAREFRHRLAGEPGGVVAGDVPQCILALDDETRNIGCGQDEAADHN